MIVKDIPYMESTLTLLNHIHRLTVLRVRMQDAPLAALRRMLEHLATGDPYSAADEYHALSHALLTGGYRRVSGNLLQDYLLYAVLECENAFSEHAARGVWDEPLCMAMRQDLQLLNPLFELGSKTVKHWLGDCYQEAKRSNSQAAQKPKDNIAILSSAVWGGGSSRPLPSPQAQAPAPTHQPVRPMPSLEEGSFLSWRYEIPEFDGSYVADSSLEELYRRFVQTKDRATLLDDLWNFHATYGTGVFLRRRLFMVDAEGGLAGIPFPAEEDTFSFYQAQREQAMLNVIHFMQGERAENMFITGNPGAGKTTQLFALARELPELRLVCCPPGREDILCALMPKMLRQPLRFVLFLDDFQPQSPAWHRLKAAIAPTGGQPERLLVVAATRQGDDAFFPLKVQLPPPQLKEFIELVQIILLQRGRDVDFDSIQNACIDYAALAGAGGGSPLSYRSASVIAEGLLND